MLKVTEFMRKMLFFRPISAGPIPTAYDSEGVYPYERFVETASTPELKEFQFISLENSFIKVEICPDLGGKVHSIIDKTSGKEVLFTNEAVRPVRILPRGAFISGGIEVSFPIAHTPMQIEAISYKITEADGRIYCWCGEQEKRFGMQWTVEFSLGLDDNFLVQRLLIANNTQKAHPWMSWSNAAVPAWPDSEFHFPSGPVLSHGDELKTIDWDTQGPRKLSDLDRMTGYFWQQPDVNAFGVFTPSLGTGLYHIAERESAPGIKLWSYGHKSDEKWAHATNLNKTNYIEIQGGPLQDQSIKEFLQPGERKISQEFWYPTTKRLDIRQLRIPEIKLLPESNIPLFDWAPDVWGGLFKAFLAKITGHIPKFSDFTSNCWAPSGIEHLGKALRWAYENDNENKAFWQFQFGSWLAGREEVDEAIKVLECCKDGPAQTLAARLYRVEKSDYQKSWQCYQQIDEFHIKNHPQVIIERDITLARLGPKYQKQRKFYLDQVSSLENEFLQERRIDLNILLGNYHTALKIFRETKFQLVHQRYERKRLWQRLCHCLPELKEQSMDFLGEDDLAEFGAYREYDKVNK